MAEIRQQIERETFARTWQRDGTHAQRDHDDEQSRHHELRHTLDALLNTQRAHDDAHGDRDEHPRHHMPDAILGMYESIQPQMVV